MVVGTLVVSGLVVFLCAIMVVFSFLAMCRVGVASVIANLIVPHWKLQRVIFSLVLHRRQCNGLNYHHDGGMVVFLRASSWYPAS
jgi:hypothetical protein